MEETIIELRRCATDKEFWIEVWTNRELYKKLGPYDTAGEQQRAIDLLKDMMLALPGAEVITPMTQ